MTALRDLKARLYDLTDINITMTTNKFINAMSVIALFAMNVSFFDF